MTENSGPTVPELLRTAAVFVHEKVVTAVGADAALAFRVRVLAHLLEAAAAEVEEGPAVRVERHDALARLLGAHGDLHTLETVLSHRLRENVEESPEEDARMRGFLLNALRAELRLIAPRFDTRLHPEDPHT